MSIARSEPLTVLGHQSKIDVSQTVLIIKKKSQRLLSAINTVSVFTAIAMCSAVLVRKLKCDCICLYTPEVSSLPLQPISKVSLILTQGEVKFNKICVQHMP